MLMTSQLEAPQLSFVLPSLNQCSSEIPKTIPEDFQASTVARPTEGGTTGASHPHRHQSSRLDSLADGIAVLSLATFLIRAIAQPQLPAFITLSARLSHTPAVLRYFLTRHCLHYASHRDFFDQQRHANSNTHHRHTYPLRRLQW